MLPFVTASTAHAKLADPHWSHVPRRLVSCPSGDSVFVVITRNFAGQPTVDGPVTVRLCACEGYRLSTAGTHPYLLDQSGCSATLFPDNTSGYFLFPFAGGGLCPSDSVRIDADGVLLGYTRVVSLDQSGALAVDDQDVAIVQSKVGTADPGADFDGDGTVTATDVAIVQEHVGHRAPDAGATPVRPGTWGKLKLLYR